MAAFRYYRFNFTAGHNTAIMIGEIELFAANPGVTDFTTPAMTVTGDGQYAADRAPNRVFDNGTLTQTYWQYNAAYPHWLQIDLGVGVAYECRLYKITDSGQNAYAPSAWTLNGSNDGTNWTQIDSRSGQAFAFVETKSYSTIYQYTLSGTVLDSSGNPAARTVRAYLRSDGSLVGSTVSNGTTGAWSISAPSSNDHFVVCHAATSGASDNMLVYDAVTPI